MNMHPLCEKCHTLEAIIEARAGFRCEICAAEDINSAADMAEVLRSVALMETDSEIQERTDGADSMSGDDAASNLSMLIETARALLAKAGI